MNNKISFKIGKFIGKGAQGKVHKCKIGANQERAIKIINNDNLSSVDKKRLNDEIKALRELKGATNIIQIDEIFEQEFNGNMHSYIIMELCDNNLTNYIKKNSLTVEEKLILFEEIIKGVKEAHTFRKNPIIHRDLKPANILFKENNVRISDFGICLIDEATREQITEPGRKVGAWGFIAPEMLQNSQNATVQADFYSLGKILYYIMSNCRILPGENFREDDFSLENICLNPNFKIFETFFSKTINVKVTERFQTINELIDSFSKLKRRLISNSAWLKEQNEWIDSRKKTINEIYPLKPPVLILYIFPNIYEGISEIFTKFPDYYNFKRVKNGYQFQFDSIHSGSNHSGDFTVSNLFIDKKNAWIELSAYSNRENLPALSSSHIRMELERILKGYYNLWKILSSIDDDFRNNIMLKIYNVKESYCLDACYYKYRQWPDTADTLSYFDENKLDYDEIEEELNDVQSVEGLIEKINRIIIESYNAEILKTSSFQDLPSSIKKIIHPKSPKIAFMKKTGFCIECRKNIDYKPEYPFCEEHKQILFDNPWDSKHKTIKNIKFCHRCGNPEDSNNLCSKCQIDDKRCMSEF